MGVRLDQRAVGTALLIAVPVAVGLALANSASPPLPASCGATLQLKKGETRTLELPGKGSTGHIWQQTSKGGAAGITLDGGRQLVNKGAGGAEDVVQVFQVTGAASGQSTLVLELVKPFEKGSDPLATCRIPIVVE